MARSSQLGWLAVSCVLVTFGCRPATDAELLDVRAIEPSLVERGAGLEVVARSLPPSRRGTLQLVGQVLRPGQPPRRADVALPARVDSPERALTSALDRADPLFARRGTFRGRARLSIDTPSGARIVGHVEGVEFDLAGRRPDAAAALRLQREAAATARRVGVVFEDDAELGGPGLAVSAVAEGAAAHAAGLVAGDRIVSVDGCNLREPRDFRAAPRATSLELAYLRAGRLARTRVRLGAARAASADLPALLLAALVSLLTLLALPYATRGVGLSPRPRLRLRSGLSLALSSTTLYAISRVLARWELDILTCTLASAVLGGALATRAQASAGPGRLAPLRRVLHVELPGVLAVAAALWISGGTTVAELSSDTMSPLSPAAWAALRSAPTALAALAFLLYLADRHSAPSAWSARLLAAPLASLDAAIWLVVFGNGAPLLMAGGGGAWVFVAESACVMLLVSGVSHLRGGRAPWLLPLVAFGAGLSASTFVATESRWPAPGQLAAAVGVVLIAAAVAVVVRRRRTREAPWLVHPFL